MASILAGVESARPFLNIFFREDHYSIEEARVLVRELYPHWHEFIFPLGKSADYYAHQMSGGGGFQRCFFFGEQKVHPQLIAEIKQWAGQKESQNLDTQGQRRVNIDPGGINSQQVWLTTFKPYAHRFDLGLGVFGELVYQKVAGELQVLPWTYPDYQEKLLKEVFNRFQLLR